MSPRRSSPTYTVGVDFGTLSARALVARVHDGAEMGSAVWEYPHGVVDEVLPSTGEPLPPDWALQIPEDWREALRVAVPAALRDAGVDPRDVIGVGTDFTACTVMPTLRDGTPLCELADLRDRPHAYPKLWKHHAAQPWADLITDVAHERGEPWIARYGGRISSEWEFAKALQILDEDPGVYDRTERWIEAADWIIWQLCGVETRNVCTAGYKGIYQDGSVALARLPGGPVAGVRRLRRREAGPPLVSSGRPRGFAHGARRPAGQGFPKASRWPSATSTHT